MRFFGNVASLNDVAGGTLGSGFVPVQRIERGYAMSFNAAGMVLAPGAQVVVEATIPGCIAADRVLVTGYYDFTSTAFETRLDAYLNTDWPGATALFYGQGKGLPLINRPAGGAGHFYGAFAAHGVVTVGGNLKISLEGDPNTGNTQANPLYNSLAVWVIRGS